MRKSHLIRHWLPRATWIPLRSEEYRENMRKYVQKQDATATSAVRQTTTSTPLVYPAIIPEMIMRWIRDHTEDHMENHSGVREHFRWVREMHAVGQQFEDWLYDHRREYRHLAYENTAWGERVATWRGSEFSPSHETPMEPLLDFARSQLVRQHRVETLVNRPEVRAATQRYAQEILWRIEHTRDADPTGLQEEGTEGAPPPGPPPENPPSGPECP